MLAFDQREWARPPICCAWHRSRIRAMPPSTTTRLSPPRTSITEMMAIDEFTASSRIAPDLPEALEAREWAHGAGVLAGPAEPGAAAPDSPCGRDAG